MRLDRGLLQNEAAELIGCHKASFLNWELGHREVDLRHLPGVLDFLGYDPRPGAKTPGERLKRVRSGAGISQEKLAKQLGVDPQTVSRFEGKEMLRQDVRARFEIFLKAVEGGEHPRAVLLPRRRPRNGYPEKLETLGDRLRKRRLDLGLTTREVAASLGCSPHSVTNWELGRAEVGQEYWVRVMAFVGGA